MLWFITYAAERSGTLRQTLQNILFPIRTPSAQLLHTICSTSAPHPTLLLHTICPTSDPTTTHHLRDFRPYYYTPYGTPSARLLCTMRQYIRQYIRQYSIKKYKIYSFLHNTPYSCPPFCPTFCPTSHE
jgi:hypothetical protein